ncbi:MAG: hypothetical protein KDK70_44130 [Myxococcales bacterium]|nr:hypothetical protein [Myxococcales bacterium]MCB9376798.1 hypothetical protein [Microthrixaceae bacterium]
MASVRALDTFHAHGRTIGYGEVLDASDPIVKGREALFASDDSIVEQATAAPGEKRSILAKKAPAKKKAAAKKAAPKAED